MAALNSTGRNSFVFGVLLRVGGTRPPRPFTYYFYRIFISICPSSPPPPADISFFFFFARSLREEILGWILVEYSKYFCVKILVIVVGPTERKVQRGGGVIDRTIERNDCTRIALFE